MVVFKTEAQIVPSFYPAEVGVSYILIVPEGERIAGIRISEIRPTCDLKGRNATVDGVGPIRTRNVQGV